MSENRWIPIKERSPEDFQRVLIWFMAKWGRCTYGIAYQVEGTWYGDAYGCDQCVIAWAPLPEPYKAV